MNLKRQIIYSLFALSAAFLPATALAHVLEAQGSVGAVMHIDPADDPVAGEPATFFFEIKDKENKFSPLNCICSVSVSRDNSVLYTAQLFQNSAPGNIEAPKFSYTFPSRGAYDVEFKGDPKTPGDFQAFNLGYDVQVQREKAPAASPGSASGQSSIVGHLVHYVLFGAAFAIVIGMELWKSLKQRLAKKRGPVS